MEDIEESGDGSHEKWTAVAPEFSLPQLDHLEAEGVNIQCVNSSEFVVGKQTNFNGPVTIINCANPKELTPAEKPKEEKIVIRDKVLSQSAMTTMEEVAKESKPDGTKKPKRLARTWMIVLFAGIVLLGAVAVSVAVVLDNQDTSEPADNSTRHFYSKTDWGGQPEKSFVLMKLPVPYVVVSHSASSFCSALDNCSPLIQGIQNYHQSITYADIAYNFLIDSSGNIYEGRGWLRRNVKGGFTNGRNVDVCLIGDFSDSAQPSTEQMDALRYFLQFGVSNGFLSPGYSLIAANATYATLSPGTHVYQIIKDWPHFDPDPISHVKDFEE